LFFTGHVRAKAEVKDETATARSEDLLCFLEFDKDERHCWTCDRFANMRGLEKLGTATESREHGH
jgi:hypothetical protein